MKTIDFKELDKLLAIGCIGEECAGFFEINYDTLNAICKREKGVGFSDYNKKGNSRFKISLRREQYRSVTGIKNIEGKYIIKPSVIMQIWLGKQYLGQRDNAIEHDNNNLVDFDFEVV